MAQYISLPTHLGDNEGENCIKLLLDKLNHDYLVWFDIDVDRQYPDFTIIGPDIGIVVIEVKGWLANQIIEMDDEDALLEFFGKREKRKSPFNQSWRQVTTIKNRIQNAMTVDNKHRNSTNKLKFNNLIAFPNISRREFDELVKPTINLRKEYQKLSNIIFKEDIENCSSHEDVLNLIHGGLRHIPKSFEKFNKEEMMFIRKWMSSKMRIGIAKPNSHIKLLSDLQGKAVQFYPERNLLIRGVAGSGKSVIIYKRAVFLARRYGVNKKDIIDKESICVKKVLLLTANASYYAYVLKVLESDLKELDNLDIKLMSEWKNESSVYEYILVDEAQDLNEEDFKEISKRLKPGGHVTIAADGAQNVYENNLTFECNGIKFLDDDIYKLDYNYRNTSEISKVANNYLFDESVPITDEEDPLKSNYILSTNRTELNGPIPMINHFKNADAEARYIKSKVDDLLENGARANEICIILFSVSSNVGSYGELSALLKEHFKQMSLNMLVDYDSKKSFDPEDDRILVATPQSVKGLEYKHIVLSMSVKGQYNTEKEKKKVYVALTRATETLTITYSVEETIHLKMLKNIRQDIVVNSTHEDLILETNRLRTEIEVIKATNETYESETQKLILQNKNLLSDVSNLKSNVENERVESRQKLSLKDRENEQLIEKINVLEKNYNKSVISSNAFESEKNELNSQVNSISEKNENLKSQKNHISEENETLKSQIEKERKKCKSKIFLSRVLQFVSILVILMLSYNNLMDFIVNDTNDDIDVSVSNDPIEPVRKNYLDLVIKKPLNDDGDSSYIEGISTALSSSLIEGYYGLDTSISFYNVDGQDYIEIKGTRKENGLFEPIEKIVTMNSDEEYSLTFCNHYIDVLNELNENTNIRDIIKDNSYIEVFEGKYRITFSSEDAVE